MTGCPASSQEQGGRFAHCRSPRKETTQYADAMTELDDAGDQPAGEYPLYLLKDAAEALGAIEGKIPRNVSPEKVLDEATRELGADLDDADPQARKKAIFRAARRLVLGSARPDLNLWEIIAIIRRQLNALIQREIDQLLAGRRTVWPKSRREEALRELPKITRRRLMAKDRLLREDEPLPGDLIGDLVGEVLGELKGLHHQHFLRTEVTNRFGPGSPGERLGHRITNSVKNKVAGHLGWPEPFNRLPEPDYVPQWMDDLQKGIDEARTSGWVLWGLFERLILNSDSTLELEELIEAGDWDGAWRGPGEGKLRSSDLQHQADALVAAARAGIRWWNKSNPELQSFADGSYRKQLTKILARLLTLDLLFAESACLPDEDLTYKKQLDIPASKEIKAERKRRDRELGTDDIGPARDWLEYLKRAREGSAEETYISSLPEESNDKFAGALEKDLPGASVRLVLLCQGYPSSLTTAQSRACAHALKCIEALKDTFNNTDPEAVDKLRDCWFKERWPIPKYKSYRVLQELNTALPYDPKRLAGSQEKAFRRLVLGDSASTALSQLGSGRLVRKALPTVSALLDRVRSLRAAAAEPSGEHAMSRQNPDIQGEAE